MNYTTYQSNNSQQMSGAEVLFRIAATVGATIAVANILDSLFSPKDTVNYKLRHRGKTVYHGVCYEDRLDARIYEHECDGKVFDNCTYDEAKSRAQALEIERKRIRRNRTKYNIQHNF
ncbi:MAG: hypothetical protein IAE95_11790 [Chitinophagaceae bacterium]|nr:hypothetical protein [Chitinophagaceae bacterium]